MSEVNVSIEDDLSLFDMHCHLDFFADPASIAFELARSGVGCFSQTLTPFDFKAVSCVLQDC